jgi:5-methylcytosine-specific restriction endonuclease McrA
MSQAPALSEIFVRSEMLIDLAQSGLDDEATAAMCRLVARVVANMAWTYTDADPTGRLPADDDTLARISGPKLRRWKKIRPEVAGFFHIDADGWVLKRDWIQVRAPGVLRPAIPASLRSEIMRRDGHRCSYCGSDRGPFDLDHIVPIVLGGATDADNLVCACASCNRSKGALSLDQWMGAR